MAGMLGVLAVGAVLAVALWPSSKRARVSVKPSVACEAAAGSEAAANSEGRLVLGAVVMPRRYVPGPLEREDGEPFPYWLKHGVQIRGGSGLVTISVAPESRSRVALHWDGWEIGSVVRFANCAGHRWPWFVGGFHLKRRAACARLDVRVGHRHRRILVGLNRRCS
ncbi:MAG TPA: hypothetical protein VGO83_13610 [Thermoleophilaceae bacterium]|nr:hypothetical protein [Thermoleophilaceae bacterium]